MYSLMIVEDEELIREGMKGCLDWPAYGIELIGDAADGRAGLEMAVALRPDIVLTDVVMAEMDGIEFVRRLRADIPDKTIRVVMISGHEDVEYIKSALKLQVVDYLLKPFHTEELEDVLRKVLRECDEERAMRERLSSLERNVGASRSLVRERFQRELVARELDEAELEAYREALGDGDEFDELTAALRSKPDQRKAVRAVTEYMQRSFREELSLAQLAAHVHLSPNYLANLYKKETGATIIDALTQLRLEEAKRLLREEPGLLIADLAERVGYKDSKHFTKLFKREVGMNPSEYRERAK